MKTTTLSSRHLAASLLLASWLFANKKFLPAKLKAKNALRHIGMTAKLKYAAMTLNKIDMEKSGREMPS